MNIVELKNRTQMLGYGTDDVITLDQQNLYDSERLSCDKFRISVNAGVVVEGGVFNPITEIIGRDENGKIKDVKFTPLPVVNDGWYHDPSYDISKKDIKGIKCGIDIFNCEFLRQLNITETSSDDFSDVDSYNYPGEFFYSDMWGDKSRTGYVKLGGDPDNVSGDSYSEYSAKTVTGYELADKPCKYNKFNYMSYGNAISKRLIRKNGWFGFYNPPSLYDNCESYSDYCGRGYGYMKARTGEFIEMYPSKTEYGYAPVYNDDKNREEYNWLTYLTYPYENTYISGYTMDKNSSLCVTLINDTNTDEVTFHAPLRHGLVPGDVINVYSTNESGDTSLKYKDIEVIRCDNEYDITIDSREQFCNWEISYDPIYSGFNETDEVIESYDIVVGDEVTFVIYKSHRGADTDNVFITHETWEGRQINSGETLSIKKVENGVECDYYFRKFKSLNLKKSVVRNSFAIGSYTMPKANVMFSDVILNNIETNLHCPITDLYFTSIKNNKGYIDWYSGSAETITKDTIEASHCFGPVSAGFVTSVYNRNLNGDVRYLKKGQGIQVLNEESETNEVEGDSFDGIGDFCMFSPSIFKETVLQTVMHRVNTAQRDLVTNTIGSVSLRITNLVYKTDFGSPDDKPKPRYMSVLDKINTESLPISNFAETISNGYYYQPHSKIRVRKFSNELSYADAINYKLVDIIKAKESEYKYGNISGSGYVFNVTTNETNNIKLNSTAYIYFVAKNSTIDAPEPFQCNVLGRYSGEYIECELTDVDRLEELNQAVEEFSGGVNYDSVYICQNDVKTPSYAILLNDGSMRYVWRNVIQNGVESDPSWEVYPFTNGAIYIEPNINVYMRRQRPVENVDITGNSNNIDEILSYPNSDLISDIKNKPSSYEESLDQKELESC